MFLFLKFKFGGNRFVWGVAVRVFAEVAGWEGYSEDVVFSCFGFSFSVFACGDWFSLY